MSRNWTPAQLTAMELRGKNLLVSAAAGSGKTATLTERIIRRITDKQDPSDISSMLVVTFTRAAAAELKSRMFSALSDALAANPTNRHLSTQLMKLGSAHICTIDAFYTDLIRSHFSELGLSASFRIADTAELAVISEELLEEVIQKRYEEEEDFLLLTECFGKVRSGEQFRNVLADLYETLRSRPEGLEFLKICAKQYEATEEGDFFETPYGAILRADALETVEHARHILTNALQTAELQEDLNKKFGPALIGDLALCDMLLHTLDPKEGSYTATHEYLSTASHVAIGRQKVQKSELSEWLTAERKKVKDLFDGFRKKAFAKSPAMIEKAMKQTGRYLWMLYDTLMAYDRLLEEEKHRRGILEFNDIRRYALRLLVKEDGTPTDLARQYADSFSEIYIDEYQDVDRVQDMIFDALSNGHNRFMVGDIKQSIYRFRGAEPNVFSSYRAAYPSQRTDQEDPSEGTTVFMSENFRCDRSVIEFTNAVCSYLFEASADSIGYCSQDDLVFAKKYASEDYAPSKVKVTVILPPEELESDAEEVDESVLPLEEQSGLAHEARYIASEIEKLLQSGTKADGSPIRPADIAVLVRSNRVKPFVADALKERKIPLADDDSSRYFENPDVQMMLCLLSTVDNPRRDIDLVGTLRSPIFDFDMNDLLRIRLCGTASDSLYDALLTYAEGEDALALRCRHFRDVLSEWRDSARSLPVDRFLRQIFDSELFLSSGLLTQVSAEGEGGNLLRLYEYARTFETGSFRGLYQFIEFIRKVIEQKKDLKVPQKGGSSDAVSLMTIHHSKGLEFPVCFVSGMGSGFSRRESRESLALDPSVGVAFKLADGTGFARINTPMREAILSYIRRQDTEEEMRVLYVALTRAREKLYVTGYAKSNEETLRQKARYAAECHDAYSVYSAPSFLSWILSGLVRHPCEEHCEVRFLSADQVEHVTLTQAKESDSIRAPQSDPEEVKRLKEAFSYVYPYMDFGRIPSKISVSKLSPDVLDETDDSAELFTEQKATVPDFFLPEASSRITATERGTATHLFLQFCDFAYAAKHGVKEELARLVEQKFIPENTAELVFEEELSRFFHSELAKRILDAKKIYREQRFNLLLSPAHFTKDVEFLSRLGEERLAVQGVIDLMIVDPNDKLMLVDYKTDRLTSAELASYELGKKKMERLHARQLSYYAKAAELLFCRPCDRLCIYSTHVAKLFEITPLDLTQTETLW